jgi:hypothetical protein
VWVHTSASRTCVCCVCVCRRDHGPNDFAKDASLSEDASFARTVPWLHEHGDEATFIGAWIGHALCPPPSPACHATPRLQALGTHAYLAQDFS